MSPETLNLPDDGEGETDYTVTVEKTINNVRASGIITINNPNPVDIQVTVTDDDVTLGGVCANNPVTVPANDSVNCIWSDTIGASTVPADYTNTVTVSGPWDGADVSATTNPIVFTIDQGSDTTTVNDNFAGNVTGGAKPNGDSISTDDTFTYTATHTCEGINNWNSQTGTGSKTVPNTASITDTVGSNNLDIAEVTVNCERPLLTVEKSDENDVDPQEWTVAIAGQGSALGQFSAYVPSSSVQSVAESGPSGYTRESLTCASTA